MSTKKIREPVQRRIAYAQLSYRHPILKQNKCIQKQYHDLLCFYCSDLLHVSKYGKTILKYYRKIMDVDHNSRRNIKLTNKLKIVMLLDIAHITGYDRKRLTPKFIQSFQLGGILTEMIKNIFSDLRYDNPTWDELVRHKAVESEAAWIETVRRNAEFSRHKPYKILVTATMSAGKSTFINALVGKKIASTKNLACTGRLHYIYSKPADDKLIGKWDENIMLDAQGSILNDKEEKQKKASYESVYYTGRLSGKQCMILDTPGVNSAEYQKHGECTYTAIKNGDYDALIFLINYEHIGTDDELAHLSFVKQNVKGSVPVIFCVNKVDSKKSDDSSLEEKMNGMKIYLKNQGFPDAEIFFVSSRAAFLCRNEESLSDEDDIDDLELLKSKFNRKSNLINVYSSINPPYIEPRKEGFEYQCGIGYIEDHIKKLIFNKNERND